MISKVVVSKGLAIGTTAGSGLIRTIEIDISLSKQAANYTKEDLTFLKEDLKIKLEEKSMNILPFKILIH